MGDLQSLTVSCDEGAAADFEEALTFVTRIFTHEALILWATTFSSETAYVRTGSAEVTDASGVLKQVLSMGTLKMVPTACSALASVSKWFVHHLLILHAATEPMSSGGP